MATVRHYISSEDLRPDEYREIIRRAKAYEENPEATYHLCEGKVVATMFFKESTRTATLCQSAMQKMGGGWIGISGTAGTYLASAEEDEEDILRSIACYSDLMVVRHNSFDLHGLAASGFPIPLVNGLVGGDEHTLSGAFYLYNFQKVFGRIDGLKIGILGQTKNCRPFKTIQKVLAPFGVQIVEDPVVDALGTPQHIVDYVRAHGGSYERKPLDQFIGNVDLLLVTDGQPSTSEDPNLMREYNEKFHTLTLEDFSRMKEGAFFHYMMPRSMTDGRLTVAKEVDADPRCLNFPMMADALWATMGTFTYLLDASK